MYLAHISDDKQRAQSILDHSEETARLAERFADAFGCGPWGYGCGLVHDIGKYSESFAKRLQGGPRTDHATAGAQELFARKNRMAAYCVAGHHSGLPDGGSAADSAGEPTLEGRMKKKVEDYYAFQKEIQVPTFPNPPLKPLGKGGFSVSFFIRMVFSCLVDADYLNTESFMSAGQIKRGGYDSMKTLYTRLNAYIAPWLNCDEADTLNRRRTAILKECVKRGNAEQGLYQITVPTGGGKTVSSLAFALEHAKKHHLSHIIYVIPYTSIIEQNARVFQDILGKENVLEDHCNVVCEDPEELRRGQLAAENWDCPVVVTTNVQFFESLFSNRSSRCRKLHNLSNSVIIFDEAQMLPTNYLKPCVCAISELVWNYHSTAVLCTATQPALQQLFPEQLRAKELCPDVKGQYEFFKRTIVGKAGVLSEAQLAERLKSEDQALCILNSRKRVQRLYNAIEEEAGTYHLSTFMYPDHRTKVLEEIRTRLQEGRTCRLIATSLVEAGVDLDFQTVYRELAGIDSVIQAAGRCNREGKRERAKSRTWVFTMEEEESIRIPAELKLPISVSEQIMRRHEDITSPEAIHEYFERLYHFKGEELDAKNIVGKMEEGSRSRSFPFRTVAEQFHLIESRTRMILVDWEPEAQQIAERIRSGECSRQLMRAAGHYCVNVYENDFDRLNGAGMLEQLDMDFWLLRNRDQYSKEIGLMMDVERGDAVFF